MRNTFILDYIFHATLVFSEILQKIEIVVLVNKFFNNADDSKNMGNNPVFVKNKGCN